MKVSPNTVLVLKSLADETRLSIVRNIARRNSTVTSSDIIDGCGVVLHLSQPTMSHHFAKLVAAQVLLEEKRGVEKYYRLNTPLLEQCGINATKL